MVNVKTQGNPDTKYINIGIFPQHSAVCRYTLGGTRLSRAVESKCISRHMRLCSAVSVRALADKPVAEMNIHYSWFT